MTGDASSDPRPSAPSVLGRPLPSLAEWLGDGARADGFEQWVRSAIELAPLTRDANELALLRLVQTLGIACMEAWRIEHERHGREPGETAMLIARAAGMAMMAPVLSLVDGDPRGLPRLVKVMAEQFAVGAKQMIRPKPAQENGPS